MAYNRAGQVTSREDQNGTVHAYDYDALGRQTQDRVTTLGDGVDDAVKRISTEYDERGLVTTITSHDHATPGSGSVVNQVFREYNHFGQLIDEWQEHDGVVDTDTTPKVGYGYTIPTQDRNTIRPTSLIYPNGRTLTHDYGNASESGDRLNRINAILDDYTGNAKAGSGCSCCRPERRRPTRSNVCGEAALDDHPQALLKSMEEVLTRPFSGSTNVLRWRSSFKLGKAA